MDELERLRHVPQAPTRPHAASPASAEFDVAELYEGPMDPAKAPATEVALDEKLRQAYFWIVNHAIISPFYDIEYAGDAPRAHVRRPQGRARACPPRRATRASCCCRC